MGLHQLVLTTPKQPLGASTPISTLLDDFSSQMDLVAHAQRQVETALNKLVATGALQKTNRMDIESLLVNLTS